MLQNHRGFTLLELMMVVAIIGILAAIAIPNYGSFQAKAQASEGYVLAGPVQKDVVEYYGHRGKLPLDNEACGQPSPQQIKGKHVKSITVKDGTIEVAYNEEMHCSKQLLVLTPVVDQKDMNTAISWQLDWPPEFNKCPR